MTARLYPSNFYLKSEWDDARAHYPVFERFGFDVDDGIEVLKLIALREHLHQKQSGELVTVKGVREGDVLNLKSERVIAEWPLAVRALVSALELVQRECGAIRAGLLPSPAMLLVIADVLHPESASRAGLESDLRRWYWATMFRQNYAQGANTQAVADARELRGWQANPDQVPSRITGFRVDREALSDGRRRNEQLLRGLLGLSIARDARDWIQDQRFVDLDEPLEAHHVFPNDYLNDHYNGEQDPVINFAVLTKSTNASLREKLPRDVLVDPDIKHSALNSHPGITVALFKQDGEVADNPQAYIDRFFERRADVVEDLMYEAVGVAKPTASDEAGIAS